MADDDTDRVRPESPEGADTPPERKIGDMGKGSFEQSQDKAKSEDGGQPAKPPAGR
jgi:hypothetical protein